MWLPQQQISHPKAIRCEGISYSLKSRSSHCAAFGHKSQNYLSIIQCIRFLSQFITIILNYTLNCVQIIFFVRSEKKLHNSLYQLSDLFSQKSSSEKDIMNVITDREKRIWLLLIEHITFFFYTSNFIAFMIFDRVKLCRTVEVNYKFRSQPRRTVRMPRGMSVLMFFPIP